MKFDNLFSYLHFDLTDQALVPAGTKLRGLGQARQLFPEQQTKAFLCLQLVGVLAEEDTYISAYKGAGLEGGRFALDPRDLNLHRTPTPQGTSQCSPLSGTGIPGRQWQLLAATPAERLSRVAADGTGTQPEPGQAAAGS